MHGLEWLNMRRNIEASKVIYCIITKASKQKLQVVNAIKVLP